MRNGFPNDASLKCFGYYGETSVCMPRFYIAYGESSWELTLAVITLNFLSFVFIAVSYFIIYKHSTASPANLGTNRPNNQVATLQKRIARIIATDFCCWIPICVMTYARLGVEFYDIAYQISAVLLLPINSAMNPILFSSLLDKLIDVCRYTYQRLKSRAYERGYRGYIVPGPGPTGARTQGARKSSGVSASSFGVRTQKRIYLSGDLFFFCSSPNFGKMSD